MRSAIARSLILSLLAPGGVALYVPFHLRTDAFRGLLMPAARWDELSASSQTASAAGMPALAIIALSAIAALIGAWRQNSWTESMRRVGSANGWLLLFPTHWFAHHLIVASFGVVGNADLATNMLAVAAPSVAIAGWLAGLWQVACPNYNGLRHGSGPHPARSGETCVPRQAQRTQGAQPKAAAEARFGMESPRRCPDDWVAMRKLILAIAVYAGVVGMLAIMQYRALHVPHGDSGMYEEHLWNLIHGRGLRSQLDGGRSFLGEHMQVIHVALLPIYLVWPSLPTLNVCAALAIASGAAGVFLLARNSNLNATASWALGLTYLLYFPTQYLNLEASWKTFRPESLAIPCVLFGIVCIERGRLVAAMTLLAGTLLAQEEYAFVLAPLGVYVMVRRPLGAARRRVMLGAGMLGFAVLYLVLVLDVMIPYFRHGEPPHYTPYFQGLGATPRAIAQAVLTHPLEVAGRLFESRDIRFLFLILLPVGLTPLAGMGRFAVATPVLGVLLIGDAPFLTEPWFHFHGPLVPLVFWAAVSGVARMSRWVCAVHLARFVASLCLVTGVWFGRGPASWSFHDSMAGVPIRMTATGAVFEPRGSYWRDVYLPTGRSRAFAAAFDAISQNERVAATDYIRPRFTHHGAAHDYPLRTHVGIDDIDVFIVDKTEGWWGRGETNPDHELLANLQADGAAEKGAFRIRGQLFQVVHDDRYFLVARRQKDENAASK